ncbi:MAG: methyl-accepting chemotaxis protein, partial [Myxococcota bacterium]
MSEPRGSRLRGGSIGTKLLVTIAGLVALLVVVFGSYFPYQQSVQLRHALEQKAKALAELAAHDAEPSLDFGDADAALGVFRGVAEDPDFLAAMLLGEDGLSVKAELNGATLRPARAVPRPESTSLMSTNDSILVTVPMKTKAGAEGLLLARFSALSVQREIRRVRLEALGIAAGLLVVGLLLGYTIARSVARRLEGLVLVSEKVARGDLTVQLPGETGDDEISRVNVAFAGMIESQRELVRQISETAVRLSSSAGEFAANARQQERGATEQTAAVTETRRTMQTLLDASREIATTAQGVLANAERAQGNSQVVQERIASFRSHTQRIGEILEVIKEIANKSDLLALNAALEGTKAGEAGKGFSLVAGQMQRLAENVMGAVRDIKELTTTIRAATQATVLATEESTKLAADTTRSVRQIALIIQQQRSGTEQVSTAMELVSDITT